MNIAKTIPERARRHGEVNPGSNYSTEELAFLQAVDRYKRRWNRPFPNLTELLAIIKEMGYQASGTPRTPLPLSADTAHTNPPEPLAE